MSKFNIILVVIILALGFIMIKDLSDSEVEHCLETSTNKDICN